MIKKKGRVTFAVFEICQEAPLILKIGEFCKNTFLFISSSYLHFCDLSFENFWSGKHFLSYHLFYTLWRGQFVK